MTTIAVLAEAPVEECVPSLLPESFDTDQEVQLYRAMLADVCETIQHGEADLLVNYRQSEAVPDGVDPEGSLRDLFEAELDAPADVRYEVQVGESYAGRVGNTLTHLLDAEDQPTVAVAEPTALFLRREHVGSAAMQLRTSDVVLGPSPGGGIYFAAFTDPIDFTDAFAEPAVETLTRRATDAGFDVSFLPMTPLLGGPGEKPAEPTDLRTVVSLLRARSRAGRIVPDRTAKLVTDWGLSVEDGTVTADGS